MATSRCGDWCELLLILNVVTFAVGGCSLSWYEPAGVRLVQVGAAAQHSRNLHQKIKGRSAAAHWLGLAADGLLLSLLALHGRRCGGARNFFIVTHTTPQVLSVNTSLSSIIQSWFVLQADNVLLKMEMSGSSPAAGNQARTWRPAGSSSSSGSGVGSGGVLCDQVVAKVADLGLACVLEEQDTHISGVHRVR
jgi:hypothetical protein